MLDLAAAYQETHGSVVRLVGALSEVGLATLVPASPAWTVRDVVAHVAGVAADAVAGDELADLDLSASLRDPLQATRRDALTARQVAARRELPFPAVLEGWSASIERLLPMIRGERPFPIPMPFLEAIVVTDLATHAQDLRGALGVPGDRDSAGVSTAFVAYAAALDRRVRGAGLPALRLRYGPKERVLGEGHPTVTVSADRFELYRALAGRRSREQIRSLPWDGDGEPNVPLFPAYGERLDPISE